MFTNLTCLRSLEGDYDGSDVNKSSVLHNKQVLITNVLDFLHTSMFQIGAENVSLAHVLQVK